VSLLFWYTGLVPDLATLRDRAKNKWTARLFGIFALGWRGSARRVKSSKAPRQRWHLREPWQLGICKLL